MIILDTNVLSEAVKANGNPQVGAWLDRQAIESLYLTTIVLAELLTGIELLPASRRRTALQSALGGVLNIFSPARILPFDVDAAKAYAVLIARARARGVAISVADGQIAAIATVRHFVVATRDTGPFAAAGVRFIDPWNQAPSPPAV